MTLAERAEKAVELKISGGYNCSQAVTAVLADQTSLTDGKPLCPCEECVRNAVMIYGEIMGLKLRTS